MGGVEIVEVEAHERLRAELDFAEPTSTRALGALAEQVRFVVEIEDTTIAVANLDELHRVQPIEAVAVRVRSFQGSLGFALQVNDLDVAPGAFGAHLGFRLRAVLERKPEPHLVGDRQQRSADVVGAQHPAGRSVLEHQAIDGWEVGDVSNVLRLGGRCHAHGDGAGLPRRWQERAGLGVEDPQRQAASLIGAQQAADLRQTADAIVRHAGAVEEVADGNDALLVIVGPAWTQRARSQAARAIGAHEGE
ncbi:MAG: hypothetical protein Q8O67_29785 [Deltaproteobacteria bacterium]|nr:hypothetical protein [Deltaproteobacteria bacterium]